MKTLRQHISQVKTLHSLNEFIEEKLYHQQVNEKLIVNKDNKGIKNNHNVFGQLKPKNNKELHDLILNVVDKTIDNDNNYLDLGMIDVSNVEYFKELFDTYDGKLLVKFTKIDTIDITGWDTSKAKSMYKAFTNLHEVKHIVGLEDWVVNDVNDFSEMFLDCENLEDLSAVENWDVKNAKYIYKMFMLCKKIENLNLSKWDVSSVENAEGMFSNCLELKSIGDISNWDAGTMYDISSMFYNYKKLEFTGDLNKWKLKDWIKHKDTFKNCSRKYKRPDWCR